MKIQKLENNIVIISQGMELEAIGKNVIEEEEYKIEDTEDISKQFSLEDATHKLTKLKATNKIKK